MEKTTRQILKKCGVPPHLAGYDYLGEAIELVKADRQHLRQITTSLYPAIAKKFGTTPSRVERTIRHAIEVSLTNLTLDGIEEIFGNTISPLKGKPTNAHFIALVAEMED